jgi:hypothetical protein
MIETTLVKRRALHQGEVGLFPNNPIAEEDLELCTMNDEYMVELRSEKNLQQLKFLWALVHKAADNSDLFTDKEDAMTKLKVAVGYSKRVYSPHDGTYTDKPRSLKRITNEKLRFITDRILDVICRDVLPGMEANHLRQEIEEMLGTKKG